jgi:GT2 family glycosyltransferase
MAAQPRLKYPGGSAVNATIIIPFHKDLSQLAQSLPAARRSLPDAEIIVAADGAADDCRPLAAASDARVIEVPGPSGPAAARNRAAAAANGEILCFVDSDVVVDPDALSGMYRLLDNEADIAGVFGAYDLTPALPNFMSQYKNLSHAYTHETGNRDAATFWAGLGAVRTKAFRRVGGFDERFTRPSVEDIDLGYRLRRAGYRLRLDPRIRGKHLKRWTVLNSIEIDIRARGIPWTQLIHRFGALANDLNTRVELRLSVVLSCLLVASIAAWALTPIAAAVTLAILMALVGLNFQYYRWFAQQRGLMFALRVVPAHILHHLCNGVSFVAGTSLYLFGRLGLSLPGALPAGEWKPALATSESHSR